LVDDGSTDGSSNIALQYVKNYPEKVVYLEHEAHQNKGISASRNFGIFHARGEYIAFLDADDIFLPEKIEKQIEIFSSEPEAAMIYGATQYWYSWTGNLEDIRRDYIWNSFGVKPNCLIEPPKQLPILLRYGLYPCMCSLLVRRAAIKRVGGFEESFKRTSKNLFNRNIYILV
jgi:glycosyltransferase involved in cell wall biosynthesis